MALAQYPPIPTIRIKSDDVPSGVLINATDFDPSKDVRFTDEKPKKAAK